MAEHGFTWFCVGAVLRRARLAIQRGETSTPVHPGPDAPRTTAGVRGVAPFIGGCADVPVILPAPSERRAAGLRRWWAAASLAVALGVASGAAAEEAKDADAAEDESPAAAEAVPAPPSATSDTLPPSPLPPRRVGGVGLDSLLRPRGALGSPGASAQPGGEMHGERSREEWVARFQAARAEINEVETRLVEAREQVAARSQGGYTYSPIGGGESTDPEVVKLRAQLRRDKQSLEAAERRFRDLQVEASLQGVPVEWTEAPKPAAE
jgi:hypothetical protein